jgi:hypothetical protein
VRVRENKAYTNFCGSNRKRRTSFRWGFVGVLHLKKQLQALLVVLVQVLAIEKKNL